MNTIFTSKLAKRDYNKKLQSFQEIASRVRKLDDKLQPIGEIPQEPLANPLDAILTQNGLPVSHASKHALADNLGVRNYTGTPEQDQVLAAGLSNQMVTKQNEQQMGAQKETQEKDYALKEREMALKEQTAQAQKMPTADEISASLMKNIK